MSMRWIFMTGPFRLSSGRAVSRPSSSGAWGESRPGVIPCQRPRSRQLSAREIGRQAAGADTDVGSAGEGQTQRRIDVTRQASRGERMRLSGKVALVTGAQQGIGRAIAVALARDGADIGVNFLDDAEGAERVADEIRSLGRRAIAVQADVAQAASVEAMVAAVVAALGPPEVLVNNAGVFPRASFLALQEREWDHVLGVN